MCRKNIPLLIGVFYISQQIGGIRHHTSNVHLPGAACADTADMTAAFIASARSSGIQSGL